MNVKSIVACIVFLLCAVVAITWLQQPPTPIEDVGSQPLRVGTNLWPGYEPLYLARSLGQFDDGSVRLVECSSASQVMRAFRSNTIEVAALTLDEVLQLKESGYDVRVILVTDISHGGDVILSKPDFGELTDLRGRTIGVENTALGAYVLTRALQAAGMTASDVNVLSVTVNEHERAYDQGEIDALVTFEPVRTKLLDRGAVEVFNSTQIPGEIVDVLAVRGSTLESHSAKLEVLLRGWFLALEHLREHPDDASRRMAGRLQLEPPQVLASYEGLQLPGLNENIELLGTMKLVETAERLANVMREQNLLSMDVDVTGLSSATLLKAVAND